MTEADEGDNTMRAIVVCGKRAIIDSYINIAINNISACAQHITHNTKFASSCLRQKLRLDLFFKINFSL